MNNYSIDGSQGVTVNIAQRDLTVAYTGVDRVYNGGVTATVTPTSADIIGADVLTFQQNAIYTGIGAKDVGTGKAVSVSSITMGGTDAANYRLVNSTATTTAGITPKGIAVTYIGLSRPYNGLADLSANVQGNSAGLVAGDTVTFSQSASFAGDGSAGVGKAVDISSITLGGAQAPNYTLLATTATTTATITQRQLGVSGVVASDRVYDGTRTVQLSTAGATVLPAGVLQGDTVNVVLPSGGITTGTLATKDAGTNKDVTITGLTLTGASAAQLHRGRRQRLDGEHRAQAADGRVQRGVARLRRHHGGRHHRRVKRHRGGRPGCHRHQRHRRLRQQERRHRQGRVDLGRVPDGHRAQQLQPREPDRHRAGHHHPEDP